MKINNEKEVKKLMNEKKLDMELIYKGIAQIEECGGGKCRNSSIYR